MFFANIEDAVNEYRATYKLKQWGEATALYMIGEPYIYTSHSSTKTKEEKYLDLSSGKWKLKSRTEKTKVFTKYSDHNFRYVPARVPPDPNAVMDFVEVSDPNARRNRILNDPNFVELIPLLELVK